MILKKKIKTQRVKKLTFRSWLEGNEVPLASVATDIRVTVVEVAVPFATVLHAQLVSVANATANTINRYSMSHHCTTLA